MLKTNKILVVDDEEGFLALLRQALEERGYEIATASNAIDAGIEMSGSLPALILMDIKMPGIDGLQAVAAIRDNPNTKDVKVIVVSALSDDSDINKAKKVGAIDYFVKPVDIEKLVGKIREIIG